MAKKIKGFLAGTSYAPTVSTDEALLRRGCEAIQQAGISSAIVVLEDGSAWVAHPAFRLDKASPELLMRIIREHMAQDDFADRTVRSDIRMTLKNIQDKSPREQLAELGRLLKEHAQHFLKEAGTDMDEAAKQREAELDARCEREAA